jgi:hypothetical protein
MGSCWVSRAKEPNLWRAKEVAKKLGFTEEQREGERLSFGEQLERQTERAEARADRYDGYAENAAKRGEGLQKEMNSFRGDIAFFTQPNINSSGGRAFKSYREKVYDRYHRGFEEYRKSGYFKDRAQTARETASQAQYDDPAYLNRRIKECKKEIRAREKNIIKYEETLFKLENGEELKNYKGEILTVEQVKSGLQYQLELVEKAMDKQAYLENCLDECGGIQFNKENIKVGYIVRLRDGFGHMVEVIGTGTENISYLILEGGAKGMTLTAAYAEIKELVKAVDKTDRSTHPFKVGEQFKTERRTYPEPHSFKCVKTEVVYEIIKASETTIQLKALGTDEKPILRKPSKRYGGKWVFSIDDTYGNTFYKENEVTA